jgi:hypothetical protein
LGRSSTRGRRPPAARAVPRPSAPGAAGAVLASAAVPRIWQGFTLRRLDEARRARELFDFAALSWPRTSSAFSAWGAFDPAGSEEKLVGAVVAEPAGRAALIHGPVVIAERDALDLAGQLIAAAIDDATAAGARTLFAQPLGLDRLWVRFGLIPGPEGTLPAGLAVRAGDGLYAWRGGSAIWSLRDVDSG